MISDLLLATMFAGGVYTGVAGCQIAGSAHYLFGPDAARYHGRCRRGRIEVRPDVIRRLLRQMQDAGEHTRLARCIRRRNEPNYVGFWLGARGRRVIREMAEALGERVLP
jgi:hypothetical protein